MSKDMTDFTNCVVKSKDYPYLDGRVVVKTFKTIKCRNKDSMLYEVQLNHTKRHYFLYAEEMEEKK